MGGFIPPVFLFPPAREFFYIKGEFSMKISESGIAMLKQLEGCVKSGNRHIIYDDRNGRPVTSTTQLPRGATIGYGHLIKPGEDFRNGILESVATDLLRSDIAATERGVQSCVIVPTSQNQYDALVMLAYNIGVNNFAKSTVVKYINNLNFHSSIYSDLESAWMAWNRAHGTPCPGLTARRHAEFNLYITGNYLT